MRSSRRITTSIGIIALLAFFCGAARADSDGLSPVVHSHAHGVVQRHLRILFLGNSYTFVNNLPAMLVKVAESDPDSTAEFTVQSFTRSGGSLKDLWDDGRVLPLIREGRWDYVVLQEQSLWAAVPESARATAGITAQFVREIRHASATPLFFVTWPRQAGSAWYRKYSQLRDPHYMQEQLDAQAKAMGDRLDMAVIPVGDYWEKALARQPAIPLYAKDGSHPGPAGTYLSALVFYRYFAGHNPARITYTPSAVPEDTAAAIRSVASCC